ncbi:hypothetical protein FD755_017563 [Muntiacus reevesi]|uniref:COMMD8 helical N-terminal domain-containing protein n=1 Tax=Muntiacus reevesi TaxID=9886 RepID=A0A5N3XB17_MUNRE|nr:hypothetical protein FD755_017563 [Muntiacus reevesi]
MEPEEGTPLWQLQKLPTEQGLQLLHKKIDGFHSVWDSTEWMHVLEDLTTFFKAVLSQQNPSHQEAIMKCLKSRKDEIKQTLSEEILKLALSNRCKKKNGEVKPYSVEMSKEELKNLINT